MFHYKICSHQAAYFANHDENMFILNMIETFDLHVSQTKNVVSLLNAAMPFVPEGLDE